MKKNIMIIGMLILSAIHCNATGELESTSGPIILKPTTDVVQVDDVMRLTPRSNAPQSPQQGMMYMDTDGGMKIFDGHMWYNIPTTPLPNLIRNPQVDKWHDYNYYRGVGYGQIFHSSAGKNGNCAAIKATRLQSFKGMQYVSIALHATRSNGYNPDKNIRVKPNTRYRISYWAKTDLSRFISASMTWLTSRPNAGGRRRPSYLNGYSIHVRPVDNRWHRYSYEIKTGSGVGYISPFYRLDGKDYPLNKPLYIDDVELVELP